MKRILSTLTCLMLAATAPLPGQTTPVPKGKGESTTDPVNGGKGGGKEEEKGSKNPLHNPKKKKARDPEKDKVATDILKQNEENTQDKDDKGQPRPHVITVPPWWIMPTAGQPAFVTHQQARQAMIDWTSAPEQSALFGGIPIKFIPEKSFSIPKAGASVFSSNLTTAQANALRGHFEFFIGRARTFAPVPIEDDGKQGDEDGKGKGKGTIQTLAGPDKQWGAKVVVQTSPAVPVPTQTQTPVLYVVDTGVQPFARPTSTTYAWHPEFRLETAGVKGVKFLQGRVPSTLPAGEWPPTSASPAFWNQGNDSVLPLTTSSQPATGYSTSQYLNPQQDVVGHGTKIASTAVGSTVGTLGLLQATSVQIESIRIYTSSNTVTDSVNATEGIYQAVYAHRGRGTNSALDDAPSVLMFASRSNSGFALDVEVALWWAWKQGMICVASGGNETATFDTDQKRSPYAGWYSFSTATALTSPSRFYWPVAGTSGYAGWPSPIVGAPNILPPTNPYLVIVGGMNATVASPGLDNWRLSGAIHVGKGADIDILCPTISVYCAATNVGATGPGYLTTGTGASLSTGYAAGVALMHLASRPVGTVSNGVPQAFRDWLLPSVAPLRACAPSTAEPFHQGSLGQSPTTHHSPYWTNTLYNNRVPKLRISAATTPWY